ncbi:hypothetical protein NW759_003684 [Fusarium solani]|nr:hypothetical protein NW759_003684 [Fusarium solani]
MSELPAPFPCWPCVRRTIQDASCLIRGAGGNNLDKLLIVKCHWQDTDDGDGKCTPCCRVGGNCGSAPTFLQGNAKEIIDTMAYVGMVIKLDSPSRRQERILNECLGAGERPTEGTQNEYRVLPFMTRKDLVVATITLGTRVSKIVECHIEKEIERKKASQRGMIVQLAHYHGMLAPVANKNLNQPRRLNASDDEYLVWNSAVREFHADVLKALQPVNDHLARTIMENIPVKWIPAVDEEALEVAKMAILKADPPAQF